MAALIGKYPRHCVAAGDTRQEVKVLISEGIAFHIKGLWAPGAVVPCVSLMLDVRIPKTPGVSFECVTVGAAAVGGREILKFSLQQKFPNTFLRIASDTIS